MKTKMLKPEMNFIEFETDIITTSASVLQGFDPEPTIDEAGGKSVTQDFINLKWWNQ